VGKTWREVKAIAGNKSPLVLLRGGPMLRNWGKEIDLTWLLLPSSFISGSLEIYLWKL
jgi:hypothetical protein